MTGVHPIHSGMQHLVIYANTPWGLPLNLKIMPQYLKEDGYKTHAVGKWHLGFFRANYTPEKRGFDSHFGYWCGMQDYFDHTSVLQKFWGFDMRRGMDVAWETYGSYTTDLITEESVKLIEKHDLASPMFLYVAHLAVHSSNPYQFLEAPEEIIEKFSYIKDKRRRIYAAMLWKLDDSVGKIVAALGKRNMLDNTIIVFTTDNGGAASGFNHNAASNWPLRGVKDTLWEGGVRGSAFIWSKSLPASKINNELMHIQDWLPTILAAVNSSTGQNGNLKLDGHNMWPVLKGEKSTEYDEIILNIDQMRNMFALRKGDWKIISGDPYNGSWNGWYGPSGHDEYLKYNITAVNNSVVNTVFKMHNITFPLNQTINELRRNVSISCKMKADDKPCRPKNEICLFNIKADPCEQTNKATDEPKILNELIEAVSKYQPVTPLNKPADLRADPKLWNFTWTNWMDYV